MYKNCRSGTAWKQMLFFFVYWERVEIESSMHQAILSNTFTSFWASLQNILCYRSFSLGCFCSLNSSQCRFSVTCHRRRGASEACHMKQEGTPQHSRVLCPTGNSGNLPDASGGEKKTHIVVMCSSDEYRGDCHNQCRHVSPPAGQKKSFGLNMVYKCFCQVKYSNLLRLLSCC